MKKILLIKHGSLGDIVFALPALESIRVKYLDAKIYLLTENKYINFFNKTKMVDICVQNNRNESYIKSLLVLIKLLEIKFDLIIDLQNSKRTAFYNLFFRMFHSAKICSSRPFSNYRYYKPTQGTETTITGLFNQLSLLGIEKTLNLNYDWLKVELNEKINSPLALFIPGVSKGSDFKQWQPEKFATLAKYLENRGFFICVVGTSNDLKSVEPILKNCQKVINKIDKSPPEIIYSLALQSSIIISNDTGPGHIATLANKNFIWIANDDQVSRSNLPKGDYIFKILSSSIRNIKVEEVITFIEKNKLN